MQEQARNFVSETAIEYRHSSLSRDFGSWSHLRAGDRAPDAQYLDADKQQVRLYEKLAPLEHTLLMLHLSENQRASLNVVWPENLTLALHPYPDEVMAQIYCANGKPVLYAIRPDGYIGFRGHLEDIHNLAAYAREVGVWREERVIPELAVA
jgi:hypothetical protein